ncbi:hypothetical protein BJF78_06395 [Pseudonocardia sp. CNS-139]|nr:hypothetical protein BJF78_06395 [Pseudonocardia sp. CNS-139]
MDVLLIVGPLLLPESRERVPSRFDLVSAGMSIGAALLVTYGGKEIAYTGTVHATTAAAIVAGVALGALFVRRQTRLAEPLVDVGLFRSRTFSTAVVAYTVVVVGGAGTALLVVQLMQVVQGLSPVAAALWQLPTVVGTFLGIGAATALSRAVHPGAVLAVGLVVAASGLVLLGALGLSGAPAPLVACYVVLSAGMGIVASRAIDVIVSAAPPDRAGAAAAIGETGGELGGALGIAALGSVATSVYRSGMADGSPRRSRRTPRGPPPRRWAGRSPPP